MWDLKVAGGGGPGRAPCLPTVSVSVSVHPRPSLPSPRLSSVPCPLGPGQAGSGTPGPILTASFAPMPRSSAAGGVSLAWHSLHPGPPAQVHAGPSIPLLRGFGAKLGGASLTLGSLVPVHPQQMHSRPTARSSKSTRAPPRPARAPPPAGSAEPVRSASPARCRAWQRATRRPALPRVSRAVPEPVLPAPSHLSPQGPACPSRGGRQCPDTDGEGGTTGIWWVHQGCCSTPWDAQDAPPRSGLAPDVHRGVWREGGVRRGGPTGPSPRGVRLAGPQKARRQWAWVAGS